MTNTTSNIDSWLLLNQSHELGQSILQANDGTMRSSSSIPSESLHRRTRWNKSSSASRDGLSDYCVDNEVVHVSASLSFDSNALNDNGNNNENVSFRSALAENDRSTVAHMLVTSGDVVGLVGSVESSALLDCLLEMNGAEFADQCLDYFELPSAPDKEVYEFLPDNTKTLLLQIDADVPRTIPVGYSLLFQCTELRVMLRRMLFRAAEKMPLISYFQSMGDIAAVFLVVHLEAFARSEHVQAFEKLSPFAVATAEAKSCAALCRFIDMWQAIFVDSLDRESLQRHLLDVHVQLSLINEPMATRLTQGGIEASFWSFRWWFSLLSRELPLKSTLVVWLYYLALPENIDRLQFHKCTCAALADVVYSNTISRAKSDGDMLLRMQSPIAMSLPLSFVSVLLREAWHGFDAWKKKTLSRPSVAEDDNQHLLASIINSL